MGSDGENEEKNELEMRVHGRYSGESEGSGGQREDTSRGKTLMVQASYERRLKTETRREQWKWKCKINRRERPR